MSPGDRPTSPSISDGLFYWIAGVCGFATGVVGAAFHLTVDALLRWPIWLTERLGPGALTIAVAAAIAAVAPERTSAACMRRSNSEAGMLMEPATIGRGARE